MSEQGAGDKVEFTRDDAKAEYEEAFEDGAKFKAQKLKSAVEDYLKVCTEVAELKDKLNDAMELLKDVPESLRSETTQDCQWNKKWVSKFEELKKNV